jgi:hypothetical protein
VQEVGVQQARARAPARSNRRRNETHEAAHILIMMRNSDAEETVKEVTAGPEEQRFVPRVTLFNITYLTIMIAGP